MTTVTEIPRENEELVATIVRNFLAEGWALLDPEGNRVTLADTNEGLPEAEFVSLLDHHCPWYDHLSNALDKEYETFQAYRELLKEREGLNA